MTDLRGSDDACRFDQGREVRPNPFIGEEIGHYRPRTDTQR